MGWTDRIIEPFISRPGPPSSFNGQGAQISLGDALQRYELVDVTENGTLLVAERPKGPVKLASPTAELGYSFVQGKTSYASFVKDEYNPDVKGQRGLRTFDQMRRSDGQVRATLRLVKTPVIAARWYIDPASDKKQDVTIAEFVWDNLTKWMTASWPQVLTEALLMLDFGHYVFEKVYEVRQIRGKTRLIWRKLAPRHPIDIEEFLYDETGGPAGIRMTAVPQPIEIPIDKLAIFTFDKEAGNLGGISVLRSAYKHYFFKENLYKIDAIQKERHGIGIPIIKLPASFSPSDKNIADQMGRNLRTNEKAHIVLPPNWEVFFAKLEGQPVDIMESIEHHDMQIARNVLAPFINAKGTEGAEEAHAIFLKGTRFIADIIRDVFNRFMIPQLVQYNWPNVEEFPELKVRRIGDDRDWRTLSFAIRNFIGAGTLQPDDKLEEWVRNEMDLPRPDPSTTRVVKTPQAPGQGGPGPSKLPVPGPPKQAPPGTQPPPPPAKPQTQDRSGGAA